MFESLSDRLSGVFDKLKKRGALSEADISAAMREVRVALLEADVALPVVKDFIAKVSEKSIGHAILKSVTPGQQVIKIVHDELIAMLGSGEDEADSPGGFGGQTLPLLGVPPVPVLMVGLQGSGKTTSTAKIAKRLSEKDHKRVLMASLDTRRPAAQEQLRVLGEQIGIKTLPVIEGQMAVDIARRAMEAARLQGFDVVMLDTAGRMHVDDDLMREVIAVRDQVKPVETLLVADALTGQDAVSVARSFDERLGITGVVLSRMDGDGRGGAALSMRAITGKPIRLIGTGEKPDALEAFHPSRIAGRILGMGDVVSLVERAAETIEADDAERMAAKMRKGQFDLDDLRSQLRQMKKMGGMKGLMSMLPGMGKLTKGAPKLDDKVLGRQEAIICAMTPKERRDTRVLNASRKRRIAAGAGVSVQDVNKLLKMHQQMSGMMKKMSKMGKKGGLPSLPGMGNAMGGMGSMGGGAQGLPPGFSDALSGGKSGGLPPELAALLNKKK
ncbi:signal recognition particle protein [Iodidimonas nitroreducens]|uniref:Signal recognition particle protein n=1 Tax=Iodidimonas nitroreducens TaxID=1236968 RepID=A0A5A7NCR1_9PROT|nr:signal recognition particle protein [Iodidimonas nitroreducens]GAK34280.1 signal recognition particle protein [alpha proteobacterium Q-1]GER04736.1 signal recognition particle protein [Iodidimonas nitroreducens]